MAKFAYICFTCKRDQELLPLHYCAIMKADPEAQVYYQVEEADKDLVIPEGSFLLPATWHHNKNLCGLEALLGMITTYKQVADNTNRNIVKVDSDTLLLSRAWLEPLVAGQVDMIGYAPATNYYCKGTIYALSKQGIDAIITELKRGLYWECNNSRIEDGVITMLCAMGTDKGKVRILQPMTPDYSTILYTAFTPAFYDRPDALLKVKCVVDCGDTKLTSRYPDADIVETKRRAMQHTLATIYNPQKIKKL